MFPGIGEEGQAKLLSSGVVIIGCGALGSNIATFLIRAAKDPDGAKLDRVQVIKGWLDRENGLMRKRFEVFDVAGDPPGRAGVDLETCSTWEQGFDRLCTVWTDEQFDPDERAFYYVRVLETPTCRWSTWDCIRLSPDRRPETCRDPGVARTVQERAWASPIWYNPEEVSHGHFHNLNHNRNRNPKFAGLD